ncbi:unnamed protein product [Withania somnifera]
MGSISALHFLKPTKTSFFNFTKSCIFQLPIAYRSFSVKKNVLGAPDTARLAETARISLNPLEVEEFGPKIQQVVDWFGQLQGVDLQSIKPAIRANTEEDNLRGDIPRSLRIHKN